MALVPVRFHVFAAQGFFAAFNAKLANSQINPRGGVDSLSVPMREVGDGSNAVRYHGASWLMFSESTWQPALTGDYATWYSLVAGDEMFGPGGFLEEADAVNGAPLKVNLTGPQNQVSMYAEYETAIVGTGSPSEQFLAAALDTTRGDVSLELIPVAVP